MGRLEAQIDHFLFGLLSADAVLARGVSLVDLEAVIGRLGPRVVVIGYAQAQDSDLIERLRARRPSVGVVVMAHQPTDRARKRLLNEGVMACVPYHADPRDLLEAVHRAAAGKRSGAFVAGIAEVAGRIEPENLTDRERDVLELLPWMTAVEIGQALCISPETVRTHVRSIYRKLEVFKRPGLQKIINSLAESHLF